MLHGYIYVVKASKDKQVIAAFTTKKTAESFASYRREYHAPCYVDRVYVSANKPEFYQTTKEKK